MDQGTYDLQIESHRGTRFYITLKEKKFSKYQK